MLKKIVFMGTPLFAVPILKSLYQNGYSVSVVYTQPPQKSQRGQKINKSPIQGISETLKIKYIGSFLSSSLLISITIILLGTPI